MNIDKLILRWYIYSEIKNIKENFHLPEVESVDIMINLRSLWAHVFVCLFVCFSHMIGPEV